MKKISASQLLLGGSLFAISLTVIFPFVNLVATSFTDAKYINSLSGIAVWPQGFNLETYKALLTNEKVLLGLCNSVLITLIGTALNVFFTCMTAYALSFERLIGRRVILVFFIITMVFEPGIIPDYLVMKNLGLLDSYWSLFLYKGINVFYLLVLMRWFEEIPPSLLEAAQIDGANFWQMFTKIVLPMAKPAIAMITLSYAVFHWNEYFRAMIYIADPDKWPLQVVLRQFVVESDKVAMVGLQKISEYSDAAKIDIKALKAGIIILTTIPVLLVYPLILKYFARGEMHGGVKE